VVFFEAFEGISAETLAAPLLVERAFQVPTGERQSAVPPPVDDEPEIVILGVTEGPQVVLRKGKKHDGDGEDLGPEWREALDELSRKA